jgi:hypothetical protein
VSRVPDSVEAIEKMSWNEMQALFAAIYVDEIAGIQDRGGGRSSGRSSPFSRMRSAGSCARRSPSLRASDEAAGHTAARVGTYYGAQRVRTSWPDPQLT